MLFRIVPVAVFAIGSLFLSGCGPAKLNENKTLTLDAEVSARAIDLPAVSKAQTINVEFSSSDGDVTVLVFKQEDAKDNDSLPSAPSSKALVKKRSKGESFSVDVPENTATRVVVRESAAAKTDVQVKVTNKQ